MSAKKGKIPTTVYAFNGTRVRVCRVDDIIYIPMVDILRACGHVANARRTLTRIDPKFAIKMKIDHHSPTNLLSLDGAVNYLSRTRRFKDNRSPEKLFYLWALDLTGGKKAALPVARSIPVKDASSDDATIERLMNDPKSLQKMLLTALERNGSPDAAPAIGVVAAADIEPAVKSPKKTINLDAIRRYAEQHDGLGIKDCAGVLGVKWGKVRSYAIEAGWATVGPKGSTLQPTDKAIEKQFMRIRQTRRMVEKNEFVYDQPVIMPEGVVAMVNHFDKN